MTETTKAHIYEHECLKCHLTIEKIVWVNLERMDRELKSIRDTGYCTDCLMEGQET